MLNTLLFGQIKAGGGWGRDGGGDYRRLQPVSLPIVHTTDTSCTRFILPRIYPKGKYTLCAVVQDICTLVQWVGIPGKQSFMSREVWVERSVVGKYEQHKCEYSWRICTIVQHSEGPGPLTASIQISYFRRFWSKWSQWLLKIHSYFLITESTSKTESKIIFCMIALSSNVLIFYN